MFEIATQCQTQPHCARQENDAVRLRVEANKCGGATGIGAAAVHKGTKGSCMHAPRRKQSVSRHHSLGGAWAVWVPLRPHALHTAPKQTGVGGGLKQEEPNPWLLCR